MEYLKKDTKFHYLDAEVFPKLLFFVGRLPFKEMFINRVECNVHNIVFILYYIWSVIIFFFRFLFSPGKSPEKRICLFTKSIRNLLSLDFDPIKIFHQCFNRQQRYVQNICRDTSPSVSVRVQSLFNCVRISKNPINFLTLLLICACIYESPRGK